MNEKYRVILSETASVFLAFEPLAGWRQVEVTGSRSSALPQP